MQSARRRTVPSLTVTHDSKYRIPTRCSLGADATGIVRVSYSLRGRVVHRVSHFPRFSRVGLLAACGRTRTVNGVVCGVREDKHHAFSASFTFVAPTE